MADLLSTNVNVNTASASLGNYIVVREVMLAKETMMLSRPALYVMAVKYSMGNQLMLTVTGKHSHTSVFVIGLKITSLGACVDLVDCTAPRGIVRMLVNRMIHALFVDFSQSAKCVVLMGERIQTNVLQ